MELLMKLAAAVAALEASPTRDTRAAVGDACRQIFDACEAAKRDMNPTEQGAVSRALAALDKHKPGPAAYHEIAGAEQAHRNDQVVDRSDVAILTPEMRMVDHVRARGNHDPADAALNVTKIFRGRLRGNWSNADAERRAMSEAVDTAGGFVLPTMVSAQVIDLARAMSVAVRAGARTIPMQTSELPVPKLTGDVTAEWRVEGGAITASDASFGAVVLRAKSIATFCKATNELLSDAPIVGDVIRDSIAQALALGLDLGVLSGSGVLQPVGITNDPDVVDTNIAGYLSHDVLIDALGRLWADDEGDATNSLVFHPVQAMQLAKRKGGDGAYLDQDSALPECIRSSRLRRFKTSQLTNSVAILGDFSQLWIGMRQELEIIVSNIPQMDSLMTWFVASMRADSSVMRGEAFEVLTGLSTS